MLQLMLASVLELRMSKPSGLRALPSAWVARTALRIIGVGHGGQILVSATTTGLLGTAALLVRSASIVTLTGFSIREATPWTPGVDAAPSRHIYTLG
jgi:hypothetical protein